ncbi:MAG: hypothetical protein ACRC0Y_03855, partial [Fusobacteriaceae bacterium]
MGEVLNESNILIQLATRQEMVVEILEKLPISVSSVSSTNTIRFGEYGHSSTSSSMCLNKLTYFDFRENKRGTLADLVSKYSNKTKEDVLKEMYMAILMTKGFVDVEVGDYSSEYKLEYPDTYEESELIDTPKRISKLFLEDNVWMTTQDYWGVRYDYKRKRIIIPVYQDEELV